MRDIIGAQIFLRFCIGAEVGAETFFMRGMQARELEPKLTGLLDACFADAKLEHPLVQVRKHITYPEEYMRDIEKGFTDMDRVNQAFEEAMRCLAYAHQEFVSSKNDDCALALMRIIDSNAVPAGPGRLIVHESEIARASGWKIHDVPRAYEDLRGFFPRRPIEDAYIIDDVGVAYFLLEDLGDELYQDVLAVAQSMFTAAKFTPPPMDRPGLVAQSSTLLWNTAVRCLVRAHWSMTWHCKWGNADILGEILGPDGLDLPQEEVLTASWEMRMAYKAPPEEVLTKMARARLQM